MAKGKGWIIPDDWDGITTVPVILCLPYSQQWLSILNGAVLQMAKAYSYDGETGDAQETALIGTEVFNSMSACNELVAAINSMKAAFLANSCGCDVGQGSDNEDGERGGSVPSPVGDLVYEEPAEVTDRDCKAANAVHEGVYNTFVELDSYNVDDLSILGLAAVVGLVVGLIGASVATPIAGAILAVAGVSAVFAARLIGVTVTLADIVSYLASEQEDLVCALLDAQSASDAKTDYLAVLTTAGLGAAEASLVGLLLTNAVLNILFFDTPESAAYWPTYTPPYDCAGCVTESGEWAFTEHNGTPAGTGSLAMDGSPRTLTAVETTPGWYRLWIQIPDAFLPTPVQVNRDVEYISNVGFVPFPTAINYGVCINSSDGYPYVYNYSGTGNPPPTGVMDGCNFNMTCNVPFTAEWTLFGGLPNGPC